MRKAIVTGHSRGLGAAIADELTARGIPVLGVARSARGDFPNTKGSAQQTVDLADSAALSRWIASGALGHFVADADPVLLVNNAGMLQPIGPLETQEHETIARAVTVNVAAPLVLSSAFVKATKHTRDRRILHISSGAARNPYAGWSVYCATKAALDLHARAVALDATPALRISSVAPGVIDTEMQTEIRATTVEKFPQRRRFEELKRRGELQEPADVARRLVDYLLDDAFGAEPVADLRA